MRSHINRYQSIGFTLIELMIALFIFAIIAMLAIRGLQNVSLAEHIIGDHADALARNQLNLIILQNDFNQIINRQIIDQNGQTIPALIGSENTVEFTHAGYINPMAIATRSTLQRVAYFVADSDLIRKSWAQLDRTDQTPMQQMIILHHVKSLQFHYLNQNGSFYDYWPLQNSTIVANATGTATTPPPFPKAIEMTITLEDGNKLDHLFIVTGSSDAMPTQQ